MNECAEGMHNCEQICVNTPGCFFCTCSEGYTLADNEECCTGKCYTREVMSFPLVIAWSFHQILMNVNRISMHAIMSV